MTRPELPAGLKHLTVWLLLGTAVFLAVQAWQRQRQQAQVQIDSDGLVRLARGPDGHVHWPGRNGGQPVRFLVDTGATRTALPEALA